jgi:hypothetical protein
MIAVAQVVHKFLPRQVRIAVDPRGIAKRREGCLHLVKFVLHVDRRRGLREILTEDIAAPQ